MMMMMMMMIDICADVHRTILRGCRASLLSNPNPHDERQRRYQRLATAHRRTRSWAKLDLLPAVQ